MAANADSSRPLMTTDAPSWPRRRADDRPMLGSADDPVTTATLPVNLFVVVSVAMRPPPGSRSRYWVAPGWNRRRAASAWHPGTDESAAAARLDSPAWSNRQTPGSRVAATFPGRAAAAHRQSAAGHTHGKIALIP